MTASISSAVIGLFGFLLLLHSVLEDYIFLEMCPFHLGFWHTIIKKLKVKYKKRILKAARGTNSITYKGVPITLSADSQKNTAS